MQTGDWLGIQTSHGLPKERHLLSNAAKQCNLSAIGDGIQDADIYMKKVPLQEPDFEED